MAAIFAISEGPTMFRVWLTESLEQIAQALHEPEEFAVAWADDPGRRRGLTWLALAATAALGTVVYGLTLGLNDGVERMCRTSLALTIAAGVAWGLPLPALYVINSLTGSRLPAGTTLVAALVTTSWGGLALLASVPIQLFFTATLPARVVGLGVNFVVFAGVGVCMAEVFGRVMARLEPTRGRLPVWWLALVGALGAELAYAFGLFTLGAH